VALLWPDGPLSGVWDKWEHVGLLEMAQTVVLETSMGAVVCELYVDHAPKTCRNFSTLASRNYYNGTIL
jgi:hypothetical protein